MTPSQLRQWSIQNSQPDQWWLSLDAVTEELPVTVAEIEERMKSGDYSTVQALHVSQGEMETPPWVEVTMPPMMKAPPSVFPPVAETTGQAKTSATAAKPVSPEKKGIGSKEVTVKQFFTIMGALVLVIWIPVMCRGSSERKPQQADESDVSSPNLSGEYTITGDNFTGFVSLEDEERATELASDTEAFSKFFLACVMAKRATLFKKGETVIFEEAEGLLADKVKLRRKGEIVSYWTNAEAIR